MAGDGGPPETSKEQEQGKAEVAGRTANEKPVKVLPCPRCESMNTKFCYYNNYSVTQPRHFCRQCQRYWTAGGTLRNVPVGGGSRKKNRHHPRPLTSEPYLQRFTPSPPAGGHFQQMLTSQDMMHQQFPGYNPYVPLPEPVMYGSGVPGYFGAPSSEAPAFVDGGVKTEFWPPQGSSMLLNLRLNSRKPPPVVWDQQQEMKPTTKNGCSPPHGSSTIEEEGSTPTNGYHEEETAVSSMWGTMNEIDTIFQ